MGRQKNARQSDIVNPRFSTCHRNALSCLPKLIGAIMRRYFATLAVLMCFSTSAFAAGFTGIWWNKNENGWGISFSQQSDTIFAAMYVYNASGRPTWYTSAMRAPATSPGSFTGDLFEATGPYFGAAYNPAGVTPRRVGTMSFSAPAFNAGTLSYNVDGVVVTKAIEQLAFAPAPIQGTYTIAIAGDPQNNCAIPAITASAPRVS
jgi:hypothetical protein